MRQNDESRFPFLTEDRQILLLVFGAALMGRLLTLQTWWCLDDWGQLARAARHLDQPGGMVARALSQQWWWSLTWPVLGLNAAAHAFTRMVLHGLAAVAVARIARRVQLPPTGSLVAGLVFAVSPVAFTVLFWASGIQELLAGLLALWAVERWLGSGLRALLPAALLGALSMLAKEPGLGLPLLFVGMMIFKRDWSWARLGVVIFLFLMAVWEISLVQGHFASGENEAYSLGGLLVMLKNMGQFGYWLGLPLPVFPPQVPWPQAGWGFLFWGIWIFWAGWSWMRGRRMPAVAMAAAVLSLGPALPLVQQTKPYMAYTAVGGVALVLGGLVPRLWTRFWNWRIGLTILLMGFSFLTMSSRLGARDPVVLASELAKESYLQIQNDFSSPETVVAFQQPLRPENVRMADRLGPDAVRSSPRYNALAGELGLRFMLPDLEDARWVNSIAAITGSASVFCETGKGFEFWGTRNEALVRAAMIDVLVGNYNRAADELLATEIRELSFDSELLGISRDELLGEIGRFLHWLDDGEGAGVYSAEDRQLIARMISPHTFRLK